MKNAIEKAIEGGYDNTFEIKRPGPIANDFIYKSNEIILLDPLFWQALGKSLGWKEAGWTKGQDEWIWYWHDFIDHLAEGGTAEDFFTHLLEHNLMKI